MAVRAHPNIVAPSSKGRL